VEKVKSVIEWSAAKVAEYPKVALVVLVAVIVVGVLF
jgi:hypothetical protein